jgi:hypothetical protein
MRRSDGYHTKGCACGKQSGRAVGGVVRPRSHTSAARLLDEKLAGEKFAVFVLVEPRAFDVKESDARQAGERQRVDRELSYGLVRPRIGLVVENVHSTISDLQKVYVAGDRAFGACGK